MLLHLSENEALDSCMELLIWGEGNETGAGEWQGSVSMNLWMDRTWFNRLRF
jgi:hypothetical protein